MLNKNVKMFCIFTYSVIIEQKLICKFTSVIHAFQTRIPVYTNIQISKCFANYIWKFAEYFQMFVKIRYTIGKCK